MFQFFRIVIDIDAVQQKRLAKIRKKQSSSIRIEPFRLIEKHRNPPEEETSLEIGPESLEDPSHNP